MLILAVERGWQLVKFFKIYMFKWRRRTYSRNLWFYSSLLWSVERVRRGSPRCGGSLFSGCPFYRCYCWVYSPESRKNILNFQDFVTRHILTHCSNSRRITRQIGGPILNKTCSRNFSYFVPRKLKTLRSDEGLRLETSAFESLYGGQFTSSIQLIKPIIKV